MKIQVKKRELKDMELDSQMKHKTLRKLDLEIEKLEREVSMSVHTVTITVYAVY